MDEPNTPLPPSTPVPSLSLHPCHSPATFLHTLVSNAVEIKSRPYASLVSLSTVVLQQIGVLALAAVTFLELTHGTLYPRSLLATVGVSLVLGSAAFAWWVSPTSSNDVHYPLSYRMYLQLRPLFLFATVTFAAYHLSPMLGHLMHEISTDTVVATCVLLGLAHLYLCDYFFVTNVTDRLSGVLSVSCALAGMTLLASRLGDPTGEATFAYLMFSLAIFLVSPYVRRFIRERSPFLHGLTTLVLVGWPVPGVWRRSPTMGVMLLVSYLVIATVCPLAFTSIYKYKVVPAGPWVEAAIAGSSTYKML